MEADDSAGDSNLASARMAYSCCQTRSNPRPRKRRIPTTLTLLCQRRCCAAVESPRIKGQFADLYSFRQRSARLWTVLPWHDVERKHMCADRSAFGPWRWPTKHYQLYDRHAGSICAALLVQDGGNGFVPRSAASTASLCNRPGFSPATASQLATVWETA